MDFQARRQELLKLTKEKIAQSLSQDTLIIQALSTVDDLFIQLNGLSKRLREWHGAILPEAGHKLTDHEVFVRLVTEKSYNELVSEYGTGMQASIDQDDYRVVQSLAKSILTLYQEKDALTHYIEDVMKKHMPNVLALAGTTIAARLLAGAGSLEHLAKLPSSTIQMLGAEKALFRHLRSGARSPKHGHIFNHPIVQKSDRKLTGKAARALADKLAICAKLDYFKGEFKADEYKQELEAKWIK